uniref:Phosphohydrolase n=1 Tax=mine drainage metagenome TaxID=410659 RepID=E6PH00_9ZZZZ
MTKKSAGILLYRSSEGPLEVLLVHPGGPFWARKDDGAWSIPKGEFSEEEEPFAAALREFKEETSFLLSGESMPLEPVKQPSGKIIYAWAMQGDVDATAVKSNTFTMEWPPKSGKQQEFPEVDEAQWFPIEIAESKIIKGQMPILQQLAFKFPSRAKRDGGQSEKVPLQALPKQDSLF